MNPQKNIRGLLHLRLLIALGAILILIFVVAYFFYGLQPSLADTGPTQFKIVRGEGFREIGAHLSQLTLIKSISVFKFYSIISGRVQKFQPGLYELSGTMTLPQIVDILTSGGKNEVTVTIPEGSTLKDIDSLLAEAGVIEKNSLVNFPIKDLVLNRPYLASMGSLEGFLFPDTYRFEISSPPKDVIGKFLDNFDAKAWPMLNNQVGWYDRLILASFLEREVPDFNNRQLVAGILLKRLNNGIPLQVDATVSYAKCGGIFRNCEGISIIRQDLKISSPYNTYERLGWTPTPIANPGQVAIKAALTPKASPYFYYLSASGTQTIIFSRTLEEHNLNRAKYL